MPINISRHHRSTCVMTLYSLPVVRAKAKSVGVVSIELMQITTRAVSRRPRSRAIPICFITQNYHLALTPARLSHRRYLFVARLFSKSYFTTKHIGDPMRFIARGALTHELLMKFFKARVIPNCVPQSLRRDAEHGESIVIAIARESCPFTFPFVRDFVQKSLGRLEERATRMPGMETRRYAVDESICDSNCPALLLSLSG